MCHRSTIFALFGVCLTLSCAKVAYDPGQDQGAPIHDQTPRADSTADSAVVCERPGAVKVAILVDTSGSMQFADPHPPMRHSAVKALLDSATGQPNISFAILRFNGRVTVNEGYSSRFTTDQEILSDALNTLYQADGVSDFQGVLHSLRTLIQADMMGSDPGDLPSTRYVSVLLTTGGPNPICKAGCVNDSFAIPGMPGFNWCDMPRDSWCTELNLNGERCDDMMGWFVGLQEPCQPYNGKDALLYYMRQLMALKDAQGAAQVEFHTVRLVVSDLPEDIKSLMGLDYEEDAKLLESLAQAGGGTFSDSLSAPVDLTALDLASIGCAPPTSPAAGTCQKEATTMAECEVDKDCANSPETPFCHSAAKVCVQCLNHNHCAASFSPYCETTPGGAQCVDCQEDAHCTKGPGNTGKCAAGKCHRCEVDQDCVDSWRGKRCVQGQCAACREDSDCLEGADNTGRCGLTPGVGYACNGCTAGAECQLAGLGQHCRLELGLLNPRQRVCAPCARDEHCTKGEENTGRCFNFQCLGCEGDLECQVAFTPQSACCKMEYN